MRKQRHTCVSCRFFTRPNTTESGYRRGCKVSATREITNWIWGNEIWTEFRDPRDYNSNGLCPGWKPLYVPHESV